MSIVWVARPTFSTYRSATLQGRAHRTRLKPPTTESHLISKHRSATLQGRAYRTRLKPPTTELHMISKHRSATL